MDHLYGVETIRDAAEQLKAQYGSRGKMRLKLFISVKGIKLFDAYTFVSHSIAYIHLCIPVQDIYECKQVEDNCICTCIVRN